MDAQQQHEEEDITMEERDYMRYHFRLMEDEWDPNASDPGSHHAVYNRACWAGDDTCTYIPATRFTDDDPGDFWSILDDSLQIYSIKVAAIRGGLRWPLHVFGLVAARDNIDHNNRNLIFARPRSNCQTITQEDPYLALTGPTHAITLPLFFNTAGKLESFLKVKGATESEDRELSFLFATITTTSNLCYDMNASSANSRLELACRKILSSVEATIELHLVDGPSSWPSGLRGVFAASTATMDDDLEVSLLAFGYNDGEQQQQLPVAGDGCTIELSRRVVSVSLYDTEQLRISVKARSAAHQEEEEEASVATTACRDDVAIFRPKTFGRSYGVLNIGSSCKIKATVAWSVLSK